MLQKINAGDRRGDFGRVDVAVNPERGPVGSLAGRAVRNRQDPDVSAFVAAADRLEPDELRVLLSKRSKQIGEFLVAIEAVEADAWHETAGRGQSAKCRCRRRMPSTCAAQNRRAGLKRVRYIPAYHS